MEKKSDTAVFTFGRFQPPTIGHEVLVRGIISLAAARDADAYVFVSSNINDMVKYLKSRTYKNANARGAFVSTPDNENPLSVAQKVGYMRKMYPSGVQIIDTTLCGCTNLVDIVTKLTGMGYTKIVMGVGSDRVPRFTAIFAKNPIVEVVSVGENRRANNSVAGMSGTKMRLAAATRNLKSFKRGVMIGSMTESNAEQLLSNVRTGLGLTGGRLRRRRTYRAR
jgi:hypothetical protein